MVSYRSKQCRPLLLYISYYGTNLYWREREVQHLHSTLDESFIVKGKLLPPGPGTHPTRVDPITIADILKEKIRE